ncbi:MULTISPECIES: glycosyltransferase [Rhodococcus]|uniref:glycosyltransferase n=1 Tax=Rhodococcus TaxID=1827 RepID=UPI001C4E01BA|nr:MULTISPECIES: glycosyltransferase [Rhodococcus]MBX9147246.1 glycosyltransferase [Rhodococcus qingshengii]UEL31600.1 glycosyltransferase [Rhodococcus sp. C1]
MSPRLVSVVIPTYNAASTIDEQLQALAAQDYEGPIEVIVSDNNSSDGIRDLIEDHPLIDQLQLRWVSASLKQGVSHARNVGVDEATGDFIAFCDADDRVHPDWLSAMVGAAENADLVSGALETASINSSEVQSWRRIEPREEPHSYTTYLPHAMGCNFGVWKSSYKAVGGCDENMRIGEDVDFSWRIQQAGMTFTYEPQALVAYRLRSGLKAAWRQTKAFGAADAFLYAKHRQHGFRRSSKKSVATQVVGLLLLNPILPQAVTRMPRGKWVAHTGLLIGRLTGSVRQRVIYL